MTYWEKELEEIKKEIERVLRLVPIDNRPINKEQADIFNTAIEHSSLEARKSQLLKDQEEHKKKMEELKERLKEELSVKTFDWIEMQEIVDKLFTEVVGK